MKTFQLLFLLLFAPLTIHAAEEQNTLTEKEIADGWILLFNGKDLSNWRKFNSQDNPGPGWKIEDGVLKKTGKSPGGHIVTKDKFKDFTLTWEWKIFKNGNNGIKYMVNESRPATPGPEYQMLDDDGHPDGKISPKRQTASLYDIIPPSTEKKLKPVGEWNSSSIIIQENKVQHWLNGELALEYELSSDSLKAAIANSKFKKAQGFPDKFEGHIMLTDHYDECHFRNIKIRPGVTK
jgi:hypothetical protein